MRLLSVEVEGFRSWRERQFLDLSNMRLVAVAGDNRAGKSSLLAAVEFALWGSTRSSAVDSVICWDAKFARVQVTVEVAGDRYRVERVRPKRGASEVLFQIADTTEPSGWRVLAEKNPKLANPIICATLGVDEVSAALTWLMRQNDYGAFCGLRPSARREVLTNALGLDRYAVLSAQADVQRGRAARAADQAVWEVESLRRQLETAQQQVVGTDPAAVSDELDRVRDQVDQVAGLLAQPETQRARLVAELDRVRADHERAGQQVGQRRAVLSQQHTQQQARVEQARHRFEQAKAAADELGGLRERLTQQQDLAAKIVDRLAEVSTLVEDAVAEQVRLVSRRDMLAANRADVVTRVEVLADGQDRCVVCDSDLSPDRVTQLHAAAVQELADTDQVIADVERSVAEQSDRVAGLRERHSNGVVQQQRSQQQVDGLRQQITAAETAAAQAHVWVDEVVSAEAEVKATETALADLIDPVLDQAAVDRLTAELAGLDDPAELRAEQVRLRAEETRLVGMLSAVEQAQTRVGELTVQVTDAEHKAAEAEQQRADLVLIRDEFSPSGIPAAILAGVLDELNVAANEVMEWSADDGLRVEISPQRINSKGDGVDAVTVYGVAASGNRIDYVDMSGSEQFRVALAIRVGLSRCVERRRGGLGSRLLIIDEGWGNLDPESRSKVAAMLERLSSVFQVLTVSHIDDVKQRFDTSIMVSSATGTSVATVHRR